MGKSRYVNELIEIFCIKVKPSSCKRLLGFLFFYLVVNVAPNHQMLKNVA